MSLRTYAMLTYDVVWTPAESLAAAAQCCKWTEVILKLLSKALHSLSLIHMFTPMVTTYQGAG